MLKSDFSRAELRAGEILKQRGISVLPVDPFRIAEDEGILCEEFKGATPGISGCLMKVGNAFGIFYSDRFLNEGFRRFTVAHELGHYFLEGHFDYLFSGGNVQHESASGFISDEHYELEADAFAAALLMPTEWFDKICAQVKPGLPAIEALAVQCATSLTATAIRYAKVCADAIAVICSKDNRVEFAFMSEILKARRGMTWIKKNSGIPESTATSRFNKDPRNVTGSRRVTSSSTMDAWFDCGGTLEVVEEIVGLGSYGRTLTVLSGESQTDSEDEEESEENELEDMLPSDRWRQPRDD